MRSAAEPICRGSETQFGPARSSRLSSRRNPGGQGQRSIVFATGPICGRARSSRRRIERVTDSYDDLPNTWTFGVYLHGELYSSIRISVLTSEWRESRSSEMSSATFCIPRLDRGKIIIDPTRFVADPDKAQAISRTALCDGAARLIWPADTSTPMSASPSYAPSIRRSIAGCSCRRPWREPRLYPGPDQAGRIDGRGFPGDAGEGVRSAIPYMRSSAFERRMLFERGGERRSSPADVVVSAPRAPRSFRSPDRIGRTHSSGSRSNPAAGAPVPVRGRARFWRPLGLCRTDSAAEKPAITAAHAGLPSPSRHIYKSLTITVAFRTLPAFDRIWQHLIKVDGTFA